MYTINNTLFSVTLFY